MVLSQFPVNAWYDLFQEHTYADAFLNRLLHDFYRLEMNGKNIKRFCKIYNFICCTIKEIFV